MGGGPAFRGPQVAGIKEQAKVFRVAEMGDLLGHESARSTAAASPCACERLLQKDNGIPCTSG
jgi:hypothetical protein